MQNITVIGLGVMGGPMATRLKQQGYRVTGVDVSEAIRHQWCGALAPEEADLSQQDAIITMLPEGQHVLSVYRQQILPQVRVDCVLIDCSTIAVETAKQVNQLARERGLAQIDAPVSGGNVAAGNGGLSLMVGGDDGVVRQAMPVLQSLGNKINHFGAAGSGQAAKACHNMICGITAMAVMEGFALAESLGLDSQQFYQLCAAAAAQSWTLENRCPIPGVVPEAPASNAYAPGFAARLMAKDLRLAQAAARDSGQDTPFGALAAEQFSQFAEQTGGELDFSSFYQQLRP